MRYQVYAVIYQSPKEDGLTAVAVSAGGPKAAAKRVTGNRSADIIHVALIEGREPEWKQDRIEGTMDLANPLLPAPQAGAAAADDIRQRNKDEIRRRFPKFKDAR